MQSDAGNAGTADSGCYMDLVTVNIQKSMMRSVAVGVLCSFMSQYAQAEERSLQSCKWLKQEIEKYDQLRKRGGSAQEMERWRQTRDDLKRDFKGGDCKRWADQLD
jgi:hypothetical protein